MVCFKEGKGVELTSTVVGRGYESRSRECGGHEVHGTRARHESRSRHGRSDRRSYNEGDLGGGEEEVGDYAQEGWFDE